jgi:hypothetical protein
VLCSDPKDSTFPPVNPTAIRAGPVQSQIRGTLTDVKDGTIGVELKGETVSIKLAGDDAGVFLVTKADMSVIQTDKFVGVTSFEQDGKRVACEVHCLTSLYAAWLRDIIHGILMESPAQ